MKILVLHNNNVPFFLRSNEDYQLKEDIYIHALILKYESNISNQTYDGFICDKLSFLEDERYDLIIIPFTFSRDNYMEYSGLRVATHIRLTKEWNHLTAPILFIGPDEIDDIVKLCEFSSIITTYRVFMSNAHDEGEVEDKIREIVGNNQYDSQAEIQYSSSRRYTEMVSQLSIKAPANYATHHSIANEWGVQRWSEMLQYDIKFKNGDFKNQLFYKCLRAKIGEPQKFTPKWWKDHPSLLKFDFNQDEKYKIAYIDDEYDKGWHSLLSFIFESQKNESQGIESHIIDFQTFKDFKEGLGKKDLIERIKTFINTCDADCYILDLRLHESDFDNDINNDEITGHLIAKFIKEHNIANQIVIFTASNKVWNLKEELYKIGASGYVIKESPELVYDRNQTYCNFQDFQREIKHACRQSYIKSYFSLTKDLGYKTLDSFINLLLIDKTESKSDVLPTLILELTVFLEDFVTKNFEIRDGDNLYHKDSSERIVNIGKKIRFHQVVEDKDKYFEKVTCSNNVQELDNYYNFEAKSKNKDGNTFVLTMTIAVLYFFYRFPMDLINLFLHAKNQRNRKIAHHGNEVDMTIKDVKRIFEEIILPIIKK